MRPYICVSYDPADRERAEEFLHGLSRYGFRYEVPDSTLPRRKREAVMSAADCVYGIVLTSPAASRGFCAADIRLMLDAGKSVLCVSLAENDLNLRLTVEQNYETPEVKGVAACIRLPETVADAGERAMLVHRLYVSRLCCLNGCFTPSRCVDDATGRIVRLAAAAQGGDALSALSLSRLYEAGSDLPRLETEAARWLKCAAEKKLPDAMARLAEYYLDGIGGSREPDKALDMYRKMQELGDTRGIYGEAVCALYGFGMLRDRDEAARLFRLAADRGDVPSRYRLGCIYAETDSRTDDGFWRAAWELYRAAAELTGYREPTRRLDMPPMPDSQTVTPLLSRRPAATMQDGKRAIKPTLHAVTLRRKTETVLSSAVARRQHRTPTVRTLFCRSTYRRMQFSEAVYLQTPANPQTDAASIRQDSHFTAWRYEPAMAALALGELLERRYLETVTRSGSVHTAAKSVQERPTAYVTAGDGSRIVMPTAGTRPCGIEAVRWYRIALRHGHSTAAYRLGDCYRRGVGVPRDPACAAALYEYAAAAGNREAQFALAVCYELGDGVAQDGERAYMWYEKSATAGCVRAMNNVGGCLARGFGTDPDPASAVDWYTRAAKRGQPEAAYRLGRCYETGRMTQRDCSRAADLYRMAAEGGNIRAVYRLGLFYDRGIAVEPSFSVSARLYTQAAQAGMADACYAIGLCAKAGRGVRRDPDEAFRWFRAGMGTRTVAGQVTRGSLRCAWEAGCCLMEGQGTVRDRAAAVACFRQAVDLWADMPETERQETVIPCDGLTEGDAAANALYMLGCCLMCGMGTEASDPAAEASMLLQQAAALGHAGACTLLGDLYTYGLLSEPTSAATDTLPSAETATDMLPGASPASLYPLPWRGLSPAARLEAVSWYTRATQASVTAGALSRRGRADALLSCAAERYDAADVLYAVGRTAQARAADADGWALLCRAYEDTLAHDEAAYLMAAAVYAGRYPAADRDSAHDREAVMQGLLQDIAPLSPLYAAAGLALGDRELYHILTGPGAYLYATPYLPAAEAYARALSPKDGTTHHTANTEPGMPWDGYRLPARLADEHARQQRVKAQALYRMAILTATHLRIETVPCPDGVSRGTGKEVCFDFLCRAVLMGHEQAADDVARIVSGQRARIVALRAQAQDIRRTHRRRQAVAHADDMSPSLWLSDYYTADRRVTVPFAPGTVRPTLVETDTGISDPCSADPSLVPVTPSMRAEGMNFLGECLYFGYFLPMDRVSAVACFRKAAAVRLGRGDPPCEAIAWAQYSLGDCLINGIGCPADPREGVAWLTLAAKTHGKAAYTLARCYENGIGVDPGDEYRMREAAKYYSKAEALGNQE